MRVLVIDEKAKEEINRVIKHAEICQQSTIPGLHPSHVCYLVDGYRVVYSIDTIQGKRFRHISISIEDPKKGPSIPSVEMIMHEFGFIGTIHDQFNVWMENAVTPLGLEVMAVNVIAIAV